jgi:hypothetical protein
LGLHFSSIKKWNPAKTTTVIMEEKTNRNLQTAAATKRTVMGRMIRIWRFALCISIFKKSKTMGSSSPKINNIG